MLAQILKLLKPLLLPISLLYGLIIWIRNKVYDKGIYAGIEFSVPVISVGNLSTGGTGKTPHIEYLIRLLQYEYKVATMSRGYKRQTRGFQLADAQTNAAKIGDEPMQFHLKFPETIVSVCEERMTGIPELMRIYPEIDVILLDDAYQHRSVKPGLNILITDYNKPFYKDFILPFGGLREPRSSYNRADLIIVSKCPQDLSKEKQTEIIGAIKPFPKQKVLFTYIQYTGFLDFFTMQESNIPPDANIILVSGIANPEPLSAYLSNMGKYLHLLRFPDHHYFSNFDLEEIKKTYQNWETENKIIVTTEKDAVRLGLHFEAIKAWDIPIFILPIEVKFLNNQTIFDEIVLRYIQKERMENDDFFNINQ